MAESYNEYKEYNDLKVMVGAIQRQGYAYNWAYGQTENSFDASIKAELKRCNARKFKSNVTKPCVVHFVGNENVRHLSDTELAEFIEVYKEGPALQKFNPDLSEMDSETICIFALDAGNNAWDDRDAIKKYVKEAKIRNLMPADCKEIL